MILSRLIFLSWMTINYTSFVNGITNIPSRSSPSKRKSSKDLNRAALQQAPPSWNRDLDGIYRPNGASLHFAPPEGRMFAPIPPEVKIVCSESGICGPPRTPAAISRGPVSTGSSANPRFASYSSSLPYSQKGGTLFIRNIGNRFIPTPAPTAASTASTYSTLIASAATVTKVITTASMVDRFPLSHHSTEKMAPPKTAPDLEIMLRTLFGW
ncbi:uncharacterized protein LOC129581374 isoform X2 [Paramacrobiotus metropolitanus]|nr:uncharacterized protein LOC129581374 isoform X2 [Paramacrobiotus metropolitanus]XP_055328369.1 uncharacterized protein LOC129581374 isoform X2 [Paramacrobiotus metropolitanus]